MRGKLRDSCRRCVGRGITPACAGKTLNLKSFISERKDHPRVCGENLIISRQDLSRRGSPPRVRGKLQAKKKYYEEQRITPACAGKTLGCPAAPTRPEDHPRVCGENSSPFRALILYPGSPPRVRGKQFWRFSHRLRPRITPACAGKTGVCAASTHKPEDHPRVCGENYVLGAFSCTSRGSPPRVRGKHVAVGGFFCAQRITPACAGKTCTESLLKHGREDHPRVCGENRALE